MKTRLMILCITLLFSAGSAFAQEYDDMYFRAKDRNQVKKSPTEAVYASNSYESFKGKHFQEPTMLDEYTNPSDSYSARNINPEYIARSNSEQASEDESNYFVEGYNSNFSAPATASTSTYNNLNNWNNYNTWNNRWYNPWFSAGYFGPACYNGWGSPYYGWNDPWMNPYYGGFNSGWSMSMNYGWGSGWGSGWNYGLGYSWGNPYYGGMWGSPYYGMGGAWGMNNWYYRPTVVVVTDGTSATYGKRPTRGSTYNNAVTNNTSTRTAPTGNLTNGNTGTALNSGSRQRSTSDEYYVRPSRRTYTDTNSSYSGNTGRTYNSDSFRSSPGTSRSSSFSSPTRSSSESSGFSSPSRGSSSSGFSSPSRSSSSGFSTPSRSSSGSSGSSTGSRRGGN